MIFHEQKYFDTHRADNIISPLHNNSWDVTSEINDRKNVINDVRIDVHLVYFLRFQKLALSHEALCDVQMSVLK
jgi:hypothetical protein